MNRSTIKTITYVLPLWNVQLFLVLRGKENARKGKAQLVDAQREMVSYSIPTCLALHIATYVW